MAFRQAKVQTLRCYSWCTCAAIVIWYYNCLYYYKKYKKKYKKKCHVLFCSLKTLLSLFRQSQHNRSSCFFHKLDPDITTQDGCRVRFLAADFARCRVGWGGDRGRRNCIPGHIRMCLASNHLLWLVQVNTRICATSSVIRSKCNTGRIQFKVLTTLPLKFKGF